MRSGSSSSSARSDSSTLYGSLDRALRELDPHFGEGFERCLDALDDSLLFSPADAFREMCFASAVDGDASACHIQVPKPRLDHKRRTAWVHAAFPTPEHEEEDEETEEDDDVVYALPVEEHTGPVSPLLFRQPSDASVQNTSRVYRPSFVHFPADLFIQHPPRRVAPLTVLPESVAYFPATSASPTSPGPSPSSFSRVFKKPLRCLTRA